MLKIAKEPCKCGRPWIARWSNPYTYIRICPGCNLKVGNCTCKLRPTTCEVCGTPLYHRWNKSGLCSRTKECKQERSRRWREAYRPAGICKICGAPINYRSKSGVCSQTQRCKAEMLRCHKMRYRLRHPIQLDDAYRKSWRDYYASHKQRRREAYKRYRAAHKEQINERNRRRYYRNKRGLLTDLD